MVMSAADSTLFTLDEIASVIWDAADGATPLDEIVATKLTAATDATWGNGFRSPKDFIGDVFQGV